MARRSQTKIFVAVGVVALLAAVTSLLLSNRGPQVDQSASAVATVSEPAWSLVRGADNRLQLSPALIESLGVRLGQSQIGVEHHRLKLSGSLFADSNRMVRIHSRFAGEVVSIGSGQPSGLAGRSTVSDRPLRLGDRVVRGQLLGTVWSKDVGEKKSDLVNALSKLYLDEAQLKNLRSLPADAVAGRQVREAEREREADIIEVDRIERTLRSWRLTEEEIEIVRAEARKIHSGATQSDIEVDKTWAEVSVRSPIDGIVLEKNVVAGDIVDTSIDLFRIADLSVMGVMANVYEEDLPVLESIPRDARRWTIVLISQPNSPAIPGTFELIGSVLDPNQHTAAVMGWLDNRDGRLRAGQFISAIVDPPDKADEVAVPESAVVQEGESCVVFVASDSSGREVERRRVALVSRGPDVAYLRVQPTPEELAEGCQPIAPGQWVVISGAIELDGALDGALAATPSPHSPAN